MTRSAAQADDNKDSSCPRESLIILIHDREGSRRTLHDRPGTHAAAPDPFETGGHPRLHTA